MLNKSTIEVLGQIANISSTPTANPVVIKYPNTIITSPAGDILVNYDLRATEIGEFDDLPIYNLNEFLSTFKLFSEDRTVKRIDNLINVSDGSSSVNYIVSTEKQCGYVDKTAAFDTTEEVPTVCEFILSKENLRNLRQASGIFKDLDEYLFETTDSGLKISLASTNSFNAKSNTYNINAIAKSSKEVSIKLPVGNLNMIPVGDYKVEIKYNSARNAYRLLLKSTDLENFKILLSLKA
jgi:hypothetical protein